MTWSEAILYLLSALGALSLVAFFLLVFGYFAWVHKEKRDLQLERQRQFEQFEEAVRNMLDGRRIDDE